MAWAIRSLIWLCWWGLWYDLIRKWMNGHKHQEKEALGCVCAVALCPRLFVFFSRAWQRSTAGSSLCWMSAWIWYSQLPSAEEPGPCCCALLTGQGGVNIRNRSSGMGTAFPINLWFMLISFERLKKGALWAGISICALTALPRPGTDPWLQHSWKQGEEKEGNMFCAWLKVTALLRDHSLPLSPWISC